MQGHALPRGRGQRQAEGPPPRWSEKETSFFLGNRFDINGFKAGSLQPLDQLTFIEAEPEIAIQGACVREIMLQEIQNQ